MRYFSIVKRSESPVYQLFDRLPDLCAYKTYEKALILRNLYHSEVAEGRYTHFDRGCKEWFYSVWNLELVKAELSKLRRDLSLFLSTGCVSASCSDEHGNTLLHVSISYMRSWVGDRDLY